MSNKIFATLPRIALAIGFSICLGYSLGLVTLAKNVPPENWIRSVYSAWYFDVWDHILSDPDFESHTPAQLKTEPLDLVHFESQSDVLRRRQELVRYI